MSRHYDPHRDCVYYADALLPADAFYTQDPVETKLVSLAFELSRSVAALKLTETELALYSAVVLLSPGQYHLTRERSTSKSVFPGGSPNPLRRSSMTIFVATATGPRVLRIRSRELMGGRRADNR